MQVIKVTPRGYCKGVVKAINMAKNTRKMYPNEKITILGHLVHNKYVTEALKQLNIETLDQKGSREELLDLIQEGIVIFTAHGVSPSVMTKAKEKGLIIVDATCSDVAKIHELIFESLANKMEIGYIGKKNHPESEAVLAISSHVHLIESINDIPQADDRNWLFTNQTTLSFYDTQLLFDEIKKRFPNAQIHNDICQATYLRQQAVLDLKNADALIVVGDPHSHNTQRLAELGRRNTPQVFAVESAKDLKQIDLQGIQVCAVTSGASTPTCITQQVIEALESGCCDKEIDLSKII